jgi:hypothetical protein
VVAVVSRRTEIHKLETGGWQFTGRAYFATEAEARAEQERFTSKPSEPVAFPPNCGLPPSGYAEESPTTADALLALHDDKDEP